jgi:hypothetical protein
VKIANNGPGSGGSEYARARAEREHYSALLAKLEYEERAGKLIDTDDVKAQAFRTFREIRDRMLNIPDRVAAIIAAETEPAKIHEILSVEITTALNGFADRPSVQSAVFDQVH